MDSIAYNMGICKSWADGSRVSTFVFQFGFISSRTLILRLCANHQLLFINLASGCRSDGSLFPSLRKYLFVRHNYMTTRNLIFFFILFFTSCSTNEDNNIKKQSVSINDTVINNHIVKDTLIDNDEFGISEPQIVSDSSQMQILYLTDTLYKGDTLKINRLI